MDKSRLRKLMEIRLLGPCALPLLFDHHGEFAQFAAADDFFEGWAQTTAPVGMSVDSAGQIGLLDLAAHILELNQHQPGL